MDELSELASWKADAIRLMGEKAKVERQRDRLLDMLKRTYKRSLSAEYTEARELIAEIEAEKG